MPEHILVVDDEKHMLVLCESVLGKEGYTITCTGSGEEALRLMAQDSFDLIISDLLLPGMDGLALLHTVKADYPNLPVVLLTGHGTVRSAVAAMKDGAADYLTKPLEVDELKVVVHKALELYRLACEVERLRAQVANKTEFPPIIGRSKPMQVLLHQIHLVADSDSTILIQGESGTGKELVARTIHGRSARRTRPFVTVDCGTVPEPLLESELFGHVKGAFTGASTSKKGLFEEAQGGTLFLDEIGDVTPAFQAKLLRVLQTKEVRPLGSTTSVQVDVRVIAATNKELNKLVAEQQFRQDLYYRLMVIPLIVPPLRERREDIPALAAHLLKHYSEHHQHTLKTLSAPAFRLLLDAPWPGNVRELEHAIERAVLLSRGPEIQPKDLGLEPAMDTAPATPTSQAIEQAHLVLHNVERDKLRAALEQVGHNRSRAAKLLGISRSTFYEKLKRYGLTD